MKRQIAEFLGELAEEMGWEPDLEEQRVKLEEQGFRTDQIRSVLPATEPSDQPNGYRGTTDMRIEVRNLRSSLNHLSSEVTQLRAEMARLKNLPPPPDTRRDHDSATAVADVRPWPTHVVSKPDTETSSARPASRPEVASAVEPPPVMEAAAAAEIPPVVTEPSPQRALSSASADAAPESLDGMLPPLRQKPQTEETTAAAPKRAAPVAPEGSGDSALELFPSEPTANGQ